MVESPAYYSKNYSRVLTSVPSQKLNLPLENISPYPGVDLGTSMNLPAQAIMPDIEVYQQSDIGRLKGQKKSERRPTTQKYVKPEGVQIELFPHNVLLQSELLIKDLDEANQDFENHVSDFFVLSDRVKFDKGYSKQFGSEHELDKVPNPYAGTVLTKFNELYIKANLVPEIKEKLEQERIRIQTEPKAVSIYLKRDNGIYLSLIPFEEWESEKGVIEYNAKLQGWEISIPSQQ